MMSFSTAVKTCFRKFVTFSGRATRAEYWWFQLFLVLAFIGFVFLGMLIMLLTKTESRVEIQMVAQAGQSHFYIMMGLLLFMIIMFLPTLSLTVRRFHDVGIAGWIAVVLYAVSYFTAGVGGLVMLVISLLPSGVDNQYGTKPEE